jgi:hypothetical protein
VYAGKVIEEDFHSPSGSGRPRKKRTGYVIQRGDGYYPGSFATLAEARREIDVLNAEESNDRH